MKTFWRGIPSIKTFTVNYHNQITGILDIKQGQEIQISLDQNVGLWEILVLMICLIKSSLKFNFRTKRNISFKFLQQFEVITELPFVKNKFEWFKTAHNSAYKPAHVQKKEFDGRFVLITIKHILQTCETKQSILNISYTSASWIISLFRVPQAPSKTFMIKRSTNKDSKTKEFVDDLPCKSTNKKRIQGIQGEISHIHTGS